MDLTSVDLNSIVVVVLEATGKQYRIHRDVLCAHSDFVKACLHGGFREARAGEIVFREEDDEAGVSTLISWMYAGKPVFPEVPERGEANHREALKEYSVKMARLYVLSNKYIMAGFENEITALISSICQKSSSCVFYLPTLRLLFSKGLAGCVLSQILVDHLVKNIKHQHSRGAKSFFVAHPDAEWSRDILTLFADYPELGTSVFLGFLQHGKRLDKQEPETPLTPNQTPAIKSTAVPPWEPPSGPRESRDPREKRRRAD